MSNSVSRYLNFTDEQLELVHEICDRFEVTLEDDEPPTIENEVASAPADVRDTLFRELLEIELESRLKQHPTPQAAEYEARFPDRQREIRGVFSNCQGSFSDEIPARIGRYRIDSQLGRGGFGTVYLGYDDRLKRKVAIKVPLQSLVSQRFEASFYLNEAQTVASLDHPHIVPVHDVGRSPEFPCYVVSKYVAGIDLAKLLKETRLSWRTAAIIVADIADALHYAHMKGLVHRDVKPSNILLDANRTAHLADFGLAIKDADDPNSPRFVGTPAYMSPEQSRGEGHRVDGRSDIYSLGAVLYEMLAGRRTFPGTSRLELLERIAKHDPKPPRQIDDSIPTELERICLKAMARRSRERYTTAQEMAEELRHFISQTEANAGSSLRSTNRTTEDSGSTASETASTPVSSGSLPMAIVPRGLRSFDENDADFFLRLLPGPRDRDGTPESIRFWKTQVEETDEDKTFRVGLIYGPSGCGKSSLVKAGLIPRLAKNVTVVFVDASSDQTEAQLLKRLRKQCPGVSDKPDLKEALVAIRRGVAGVAGHKVLIVIDQFEQWLHSRKQEQNTELVAALRQCDGIHIQSILLVRDDFWLGISRLMQELEISLMDGKNLTLVDLFDLSHARKVLIYFGKAYGRLPEHGREFSPEEIDFLDSSIQALASDGKVVCVRVALFAQMMKGRQWSPESFRQVGGIHGIGATFLDDTFGGVSNPGYRLHQSAARRILNSLLPETSIDIKGQLRSDSQLRETSGYSNQPKQFDDLIRILDSELRLISPVEPGDEAVDCDDADPDALRSRRPDRFYQLSHDYLVPSLREWLTRKQKNSRAGRAELRLAERSAFWNAKPENRRLPSAIEWGSIHALADKRRWSLAHRQMMRRANWFHGIRLGLGLVVALIVMLLSQQFVASIKQRNLLARMETAIETMANSRGNIVPRAIEDLRDYPEDEVVSELHSKFADSDASQLLALGYALAYFGDVETEFFISKISSLPAVEVANVNTALSNSRKASLALIHATSTSLGDVTLRDNETGDLRYRLAIIALHLGDDSLAREICRRLPNMIHRTNFVDRLSTWHGDDSSLAQIAVGVTDPNLRMAICMGIGETPFEQLTENAKLAWEPVFSNWFQQDRDSGVHSAAGWALRKLNLDLPAIATTRKPIDGRQWHVNDLGMTMLEVPAGSFVRKETQDRNSATSSREQKIILTESLLVSDREISNAVFRRFIDDPGVAASEKPIHQWNRAISEFEPTGDHPAQLVDWHAAALFCNWLSAQEGFQPCYRPTGKMWDLPTDGNREQMEIVADADGYRLPTEAEWEYSCRAGTTTQYSFGNDLRLANRYVVYGSDRTKVCGDTLPNAWGLFNLHGNVSEWCQEWSGSYGNDEMVTDPLGPARHPLLFRVARGGAFQSGPISLSSGYRGAHVLSAKQYYLGFRVVRNNSPKPDEAL